MSKSSNDSGANDSSIDAAGVVPVASAAKASAVLEAAATRATNAAIAPVLPVLVAEVDSPAGDAGSASAPDADVDAEVLDDAGVAAGVLEAEPVTLADGVPAVGVGAAADERPAEDAAAAGVEVEEALADELPGSVGRGGGFAAGGGDAAGAGRAGGTVGIAAFEIGLLTGATRGVALGLAADGVAGRLVLAGEPAVAAEGGWAVAECGEDGGDWAAEEVDCAVDVAGEAAAGDGALPATGAGFEAPAGRTLEVVVELTGRVADAPTGVGPPGARREVPDCAAAAAAITLAARSLAALAAGPSRDPESVTPLSVVTAAREVAPAAEGDGALVADALLVAPPMPGIPNPAGDVGFPAVAGVVPAARADEGAEVSPEAEADAAAEAGSEADAGAEADAGPEADTGPEADACDGAFEDDGAEDDAAGADVDACDVAPLEVGADAPPPAEAESVSTGPSGSNN